MSTERLTPEKMLSEAGYLKRDEPFVDPAMVAPVQDALDQPIPPRMPAVGDSVHFYHLDWENVPYPAVVTAVDVQHEGGLVTTAAVDLSVFSGDEAKPIAIFKDVPVVNAGAVHENHYWWQWPPRGG